MLLELVGEKFEITGNGRYRKTKEHSSLVIDVERDLFYWNSRGIAGDAFVWLTEVENHTIQSAKEIIKKMERLENQVYVEIQNTSGEEILVYPRLVEIFWKNGKLNRDYWYTRGFTDRTIDRFQLGFYNGWNTIPFFLNGTFMNFQIRRDTPDKRIKNWYRGVGPLLYNADLLKYSPTIIITESPTDAVLLNQNGFPAVSHNGGADFWTPVWYKYFIQQHLIYILYDNDPAGKSGAKRVAKALGENRCYVYNFEDFPEKFDVGDWFKIPGNSRDTFFAEVVYKAKRIFEI